MEEEGVDCANGNFVTVVSIGNDNLEEKIETNTTKDTDFVTVLRIGEKIGENEEITEEVLVYRLPGERLGFGLKFEGGTKANEYVKRLYIQSCAPDSPASRVLSSWGNLTEGDEVLVIDSHPVSSMTRMDCVKCLKDSNVIIKLLVRHSKQNVNNEETNDFKNRVVEDLPQVISAEKKKLPPPPPPVPPRKVPRKLLKSNQAANSHKADKKGNTEENNPLPPIRQKHADANNNGNQTKTSKIRTNSPEAKRNRKYSGGSIGPPDAEFYTDLFSQESLHSLSESDDTASTISTVIDRNGSSLPSTPKSIQKHLDISNFPNDEELFNINSGGDKLEFQILDDEDYDRCKLSEDSESYIDEVDESKTKAGIIAEYKTEDSVDQSAFEDDDLKKDSTFQAHDENMNIFSLPRLVDFVPKTCNETDQTRLMNLFLESERSEHYDFGIDLPEEGYGRTSFDSDIDVYQKWSVSPQLATIGEVEEESNPSESLTEGSTTSISLPMPIVIVQSADEIADKKEMDTPESTEETEHMNNVEKIMEPLPSDPRQPPDGHEFPDFEESFRKTTNDTPLDEFKLNFNHPHHIITPNINQNSSFKINSSDLLALSKNNSMSNTDLSAIPRDKDFPLNEDTRTEGRSNLLLHTRSQSLCDISFSQKQTDQWNNLVEQRRKSLSKLKGLVIPDSISENDCSSTINLPEIKSSTTVSIETFNSLDSSEISNESSQPSSVDSSKFPLISPPWTGTVNFPKYSPAFKRKDLQLYSTISKQEVEKGEVKTYKASKMKKSVIQTESSSGDDSTIPLKSVDSSPTRSESSFEYITSRNKLKQRARPFKYSMETSFLSDYHKTQKEINTEDESDNDSAVSSSQSSFISRPTASPSPTRSFEYDSNTLRSVNSEYKSSEARHLKPASVEAINRKNILASAKCRSGKDLKVGSPVINRKLEDSEEKTEEKCDNKIMSSPLKTEEVTAQTVKEDFTDIEWSFDEVKIEKASTKVVNNLPLPARRLSADTISTISHLPPKPSTALLKTKFETLVEPLNSKRQSYTRSISLKPIPPSITKREEKVSRFSNSKSLSVTDLRKNFEEIAKTAPLPSNLPIRKQEVALKTRKSEPLVPDVVSNKSDNSRNKHKLSDLKLRSSLDNKATPEMKISVGKTRKVILKPDVVGGSLGITLAGGTDENKEISVHRIRYGSVAYQEGSLIKGDHITSINGVETKGLSHFEAVELLKAPVKSFIINVAVRKEEPKDENILKRRAVSLDSATDSIAESASGNSISSKKANHEIILQKDGSGLGFSIEGGRDSPQGDVPLIVKKIFQGGVAEKDGRLKVGDEILAINDTSFTNLSRIQAWTMMKKIDVRDVKILIYR